MGIGLTQVSPMSIVNVGPGWGQLNVSCPVNITSNTQRSYLRYFKMDGKKGY